jgi:hypothetical protein
VQRPTTPDSATFDTAQEDANLKQAAAIITDINNITRKVDWLFYEQILPLLPSVQNETPLSGAL